MGDVRTGRTFMLKDVLQKVGVSQRQLAIRMDKPEEWLSRIAMGKTLPSWDTACKIAEALGVSVGAFADQDPAQMQMFTSLKPAVGSEPTTPRSRPRSAARKRGA